MVNAYYPKTLQEALLVRKETAGKSLIICGGSDVMVVRKTAENVIFINQIAEIQKVEVNDGFLRIGAGVVYSDLLKNDLIPSILKEAISQIASPAIRNVGTIGGNICNASPAGDSLPVLYSLNAKVETASLNEDGNVVLHQIPIQEFILGIRKIALKDHEIVSSIIIEDLSDYITYYQKVGARKSEAISKASFAALGKLEGGKITDVRNAFGSVGITVVRFLDLEKEIIGLSIEQLKIKKEEIVSKYMERINPIDDQRSTALYRKTVCKNLLSDFLESLRG
ncbi:MAG: FAD binding domain-containing protein [Treponema sp.]|nr:FAD binding domain-containing protein [Treponema sp.]